MMINNFNKKININLNKGFIQHKNFLRNFCAGFTLIEVMVAVSIFAIVMMVAVGAILSIVAANKKAQALNSVINNVNFAVESMVRDLRTGENYDFELNDCSSGCNSVTFDSTIYGEEITYEFDEADDADDYGKIIQTSESDGDNDFTASEVNITELKFYNNPGNTQPRILMTLKAESRRDSGLKFNLQTMISQRKLEINGNPSGGSPIEN